MRQQDPKNVPPKKQQSQRQAGWQAGLTALFEEIQLVKGSDPEVVAAQQRIPVPVTQGRGAGAASAASASDAAGGGPAATTKRLSMAQKVSRIKEELSLEPGLPIAKAVAEANEAMGIEPAGSMAAQVDLLLSELGVS